jgi:methyl-accepting chemotaxis protein
MRQIEVPEILFLIFTIVVVLSLALQTWVIVTLLVTARKAVEKVEQLSGDFTTKALPILAQTRAIVEDLSPKLKVISANLVEVSTTLKDQTKHVNATVGDVVDKTRQQADRVDEMVSAILDGVSHAGATIQAGVSKPVRQVNGIFQGLRAGLESFFSKEKPARSYGGDPRAEKMKF